MTGVGCFVAMRIGYPGGSLTAVYTRLKLTRRCGDFAAAFREQLSLNDLLIEQ
jgi:hypothetical protein